MAKNIFFGFLYNFILSFIYLFIDFLLNIVVNVNFFNDFKFEHYSEYCPKNYWAMKYLCLWSPEPRNAFRKICKTSSLPTLPASYILNARSLRWTSDVPVKKTTLVNDGSTSNTTFWWALQTQLEWITFEVGRTQFGSQGTELWEPYIYTWVFLFESSI